MGAIKKNYTNLQEISRVYYYTFHYGISMNKILLKYFSQRKCVENGVLKIFW